MVNISTVHVVYFKFISPFSPTSIHTNIHFKESIADL